VTDRDAYEPTVSIIVPALNAEATIGSLLESLVQVDYDERKLEIIVVDGRSTDRTREIVEKYPVKMILQDGKGLNLARNTGFRRSSGEIVLFTDSDCVVPRDWARLMVRNFETAGVGCVGGSVSRYKHNFLSRYADDSIMPVLRKFRKREVLDNVEPPLRYPAGCNMAFRRNAVEEAGEFDEDIHYGFDEDELVERVCKAGYKMVLDPETITKHQYRDTFGGFLKQTFNYGRGGALLFKNKQTGARLARWNLATLAVFLVWLIASISLAFLAINVSAVFLIPLVLIPLVPFVLLTLFYLYKGLEERDWVSAFTYPCMDVLRLIAYCTGEIYEAIR